MSQQPRRLPSCWDSSKFSIPVNPKTLILKKTTHFLKMCSNVATGGMSHICLSWLPGLLVSHSIVGCGILKPQGLVALAAPPLYTTVLSLLSPSFI